MKLAVVGAGISGNLVARLLSARHEVELFEANDYAGGHTNTVAVDVAGRSYDVDTGFMVFNHTTYPNFARLLRLLDVDEQSGDMSLSVSCRRTGFEFQGSSLNGLFAQRRNLVRFGFWGMLRDILRFNREATQFLDDPDEGLTLGDFVRCKRYGREFVERYLVPMGAAIWSARPDTILEFPAHFILRFYRNHGLLQLRGRPRWKTIPGGARRYVRALLAPLGDRVRLATPVRGVTRHGDHVVLRLQNGETEAFDGVVMAAHADQTLYILEDVTATERELLSCFPYQDNLAVLHTDPNFMPRSRRAWASWNYQIPAQSDLPVSVTYDLNRLQNLGAPQPIMVSLNPAHEIRHDCILRQFTYHHPVFGPNSPAAQQRLGEINGLNRTWFCGAYWGSGFHEDGVNSALTVARLFGLDLDACKAVSTKASPGTDVFAR